MTTHEEMHRLHNTASLMLPGFKQAQAQMAAASHVLEYFARFPEYEISPGKYPSGTLPYGRPEVGARRSAHAILPVFARTQ